MPPGVMHDFPVSERAVQRRTPRYFSEVQTLDVEGAQRMLGVTRDLIARATALVDHVDRNRHEARLSGVETIAIELSAILEGGKLESVQDALEEAVRNDVRPAITIEGFSKLRRAEFLVGEVDQSIERYVKTPIHEMGRGYMPQYAPPRLGTSLSEIPTSLLILGVIGAGAILAVVIIALTKASK
jgi:hypothetical protein